MYMSVMSNWLVMLLAGDVQSSEDSDGDESSGEESAVGTDPALVEQPLFTTPASPAFRDWEKHTRVSWHIFQYSPCNYTSVLMSCPTAVFYYFRVLALA
jgi:hypothetical protein